MFESVSLNDSFQELHTLIGYTFRAKKIAKFMNVPISFDMRPGFSADEHAQVSRFAEVIDSVVYHASDFQNNTKLSFNFLSENQEIIKSIINTDHSTQIQIVEEVGQSLKLFNEILELPPRVITFNPVKVVTDIDVDNLQEGDSFDVELIPVDDFLYQEVFVSKSDRHFTSITEG